MKSLFFIGLIPCHFFFFFFFCNLCLISLGNICKWVEVLKPQSKCCEDEVAPTGCMLGHKMDMWQIKKISFSYASCNMLKDRVQQVTLINLSIARFHQPQLIPSVCCMREKQREQLENHARCPTLSPFMIHPKKTNEHVI